MGTRDARVCAAGANKEEATTEVVVAVVRAEASAVQSGDQRLHTIVPGAQAAHGWETRTEGALVRKLGPDSKSSSEELLESQPPVCSPLRTGSSPGYSLPPWSLKLFPGLRVPFCPSTPVTGWWVPLTPAPAGAHMADGGADTHSSSSPPPPCLSGLALAVCHGDPKYHTFFLKHSFPVWLPSPQFPPPISWCPLMPFLVLGSTLGEVTMPTMLASCNGTQANLPGNSASEGHWHLKSNAPPSSHAPRAESTISTYFLSRPQVCKPPLTRPPSSSGPFGLHVELAECRWSGTDSAFPSPSAFPAGP